MIPGRRLDWFATLDSTMLEAQRDPEPGRIIVADEQTAGMGRHGRSWHSAAGEGLYVTFVLAIKPSPVVALALGLAVHDLIQQSDLRWPNDVLLNEKKCAGILAKADNDMVLAGIGINVNQQRFPDNLDTPATSLLLEDIHTTREALLTDLVPAIDRTLTLPGEEIRRRFAAASSYVYGKRVRVDNIEGVTCGLDPSGFLRIRDDNGTEHTILNGGVRPI